jgi:hypothetical protein
MKNLILALAVICVGLSARAQDKIGNGGDEVALEFNQAFSTAIRNINEKLPHLAAFLNTKELSAVIAKATILITDGPLPVSLNGIPQSSIATNDVEKQQVLIQRARWKELTNSHIKEALALHEILSLARLESTGQYAHSGMYLTLFELYQTPQDAFKAACGSVEFGVLERTRDRYNVGEYTATDVAMAEYGYQKALFNKCGSINKYYFCSTAEAVLKLIVFGMSEEASFGQRTPKEVDDAKIELDNHQHFCR